jgi:hypothetical protein
MRLWLLMAAVAVAIAGCLWYIEAPPRTPHSYDEEAVRTAERLRSQVETDSLWIRALADGDALRPTAAVAFREADEDAAAAVDEFTAIVPPAGTDELRADVGAVGADVTDALSRVRVAAERDEWDRLGEEAEDLDALGARLERLIQRADT